MSFLPELEIVNHVIGYTLIEFWRLSVLAAFLVSKVEKYVSKNWHSHNFIGYVGTTFLVSNLGHLSIAYTLADFWRLS